MRETISSRIKILAVLRGGGLTVDGIWRLVRPMSVGYGTISPTLNVARHAGLVTRSERIGNRPCVWVLTEDGRKMLDELGS